MTNTAEPSDFLLDAAVAMEAEADTLAPHMHPALAVALDGAAWDQYRRAQEMRQCAAKLRRN